MGGETYTLHYFNARGLAEPIRLILSYGGAKWEDERVPFTGFGSTIPAELKARLPYGQVPFLEFDGQGLCQATTIARYLARKYNLVGESELEAARCDEVVDAVKDFMAAWTVYGRKYLIPDGSIIDEAEKAEALKKVVSDTTERYLTKFESILAANGGHLVGQKLTWADITVVHCITNIKIEGVSLIDNFPGIQQLIKTVTNTSGIKEWIEKRPVTML